MPASSEISGVSPRWMFKGGFLWFGKNGPTRRRERRLSWHGRGTRRADSRGARIFARPSAGRRAASASLQLEAASRHAPTASASCDARPLGQIRVPWRDRFCTLGPCRLPREGALGDVQCKGIHLEKTDHRGADAPGQRHRPGHRHAAGASRGHDAPATTPHAGRRHLRRPHRRRPLPLARKGGRPEGHGNGARRRTSAPARTSTSCPTASACSIG